MEITDKQLEQYLNHKKQFTTLPLNDKKLFKSLQGKLKRKTIDIKQANDIWNGR